MKVKRFLSLKLPLGQSTFLWGPRNSGKSTYLRDHFPGSIYYDLRPLHNFGLCKKAGHFDDILSLSKPAYVGRPIGGKRKSKDRKKTGFTTHPKLCRGLKLSF